MRLLGKNVLVKFKHKHADIRSQIESWEAEIREAKWSTPQKLKERYPKASILKNQQVIFDYCRNKYRLLAMVNYKNGIILIKKIGEHKEYNNWGNRISKKNG